ncbi:MAG: sodium:solute symporter [Planctomycetia bacterium]|nr:sodium:solute symporter [Planctomycetia bacterium]
MKLSLLNIIVMVLYFGILLAMGCYFARRQKGTDDYFRGGGRIPWWAAGLSLVGTGLSAITYMSVPAKSFFTDWSYFLLNFGTFWVVPIVVLLYVPCFRRMNLTSAYEFLEKRFNLALRLFGSAFFILFQLGRMAIVMYLPSLALSVVTGIDIYSAILLVGVVSLVYTFFGGVEAVVWTDVLQVFILLGGALLILGIAVFRTDGGFNTMISTGLADQKFRMIDPSFDLAKPSIWVILSASIFTYLTTYTADQSLVQRYFITKDEKDAVRGIWTNGWIAIPVTLLFFTIGTALYVFYQQNPSAMNPAVEKCNDSLLPWFIISQMPDGVSGLLIVGIFAASMSSLSASMNSIATAYTVDFHDRLHFRYGLSSMAAARMITLLSGIIGIGLALAMAIWNVQSLWDEYNRIVGLIISGLGGLFFLGAATRRANGPGAICGIIACIIVQFVLGYYQTVHLLFFSTTGFVSCVVIGWLASFLFTKKEEKSAEK